LIAALPTSGHDSDPYALPTIHSSKTATATIRAGMIQ
jgi:hypothetical protein